MNATVKKLFEVVEKLHPDFRNKMLPPATEEQIQTLISTTGITPDDAFLDFYHTFNGENILGLGLGLFFMEIDRILAMYTMEFMDWFSIADNPELTKNIYRGKLRIPFVEDGGGSQWFLDYDPNKKGKMGQTIVIFRDMPETIYNVAPSFEAYLQLIIDEIEHGAVRVIEDQTLVFTGAETGYYRYSAVQSRKLGGKKALPPKDAFKGMNEGWQFAVTGMRNFLTIRGIEELRPEDAHFVKELRITPDLMPNFHYIQHFKNLQFLTIAAPEMVFSKENQAILANKPLTYLQITSEVSDISFLKKLPQLQELILTNLKDATLEELAKLPNLRKLNLVLNVSPDNLTFLKKCKNLQELTLGSANEETKLSKKDVETIAQCPKLSYLALTFFSMEYANVLEKSKTLNHVNISRNL